ncbi:MAG: hypothetical protein ACLFVE_08460 [Chitinispirillaceae bacterium]
MSKKSVVSFFSGILQFYRFFVSVVISIAFSYLLDSVWIWLPIAVLIRFVWYRLERFFEDRKVKQLYDEHAPEFKQLTGPYGIRLINKAEKNPALKRSLAEVFTSDEKKLKETLKQLKMLDTLFSAGMTPDGDSYQLHDLKLKYAKYRVGKTEKQS